MTKIKDQKKEYNSVEFKELKYAEKIIEYKEFDGCSFVDCLFNATTFKECKFIDCEFVGCDLSLLTVPESKFNNVGFEQCKCIGINWTKADWSVFNISAALHFRNSMLNDSSFFGLHLEDLVIEKCKAQDVDFREGSFKGGNFAGTDFSDSMFHESNLIGVDFTEAQNYKIDIFYNKITGAKLSRFEALRLLESVGVVLVD